ncbi:OmpA family protein [Zavarzinia compransoris]|uniref:OmpA family protein n=1 Tax=Zavarzinia marina TaxID=2911065 RepID=UPI001F3428C2|nr:OmpA family protein [Zavarzinia marina]MCF4164243.1 OmpA family protein [Zavarzinia marina]
MRLALGLVSAAAILVTGAAAQADMVSGPYITGFGGYTINPDTGFEVAPGTEADVSFEDGWVGGAAVGYDFGRARIEFEGAYRDNEYDTITLGGVTGSLSDNNLKAISGMINALYDFENESVITPYLGFGMGAANLDDDVSDESDTVLAYQGIAGTKISVTENLSAVVDYRYFRTLETDLGGAKFEYEQHTITAGLSYNFGTPAAPPPPPPPAPVVAEPPPPEVARSYMVFFDWDSTVITADAAQIIRDAASAAQTLGVARIELTGHADRSGSTRYNQGLSLRRADAVKAELIALGVAPDSISTVGKGESAPLVPTPDGVREAQNRRVEIVLP